MSANTEGYEGALSPKGWRAALRRRRVVTATLLLLAVVVGVGAFLQQRPSAVVTGGAIVHTGPWDCSDEMAGIQAALEAPGSEAAGLFSVQAAHCDSRWALAIGRPNDPSSDRATILLEQIDDHWRLLTFGTALGSDAILGVPQDVWDRLVVPQWDSAN